MMIDRLKSSGSLIGVALAQLFACSSPASAPTPAPSSPPTPARSQHLTTTPVAPSISAAPKPTPEPASAARPCRNGERLDSGCECRDGACFDICCGPEAGCAHPASPGGPSACMLLPTPVVPAPPPRACTDGESIADGCTCTGKTCMDLCCVGSVCAHNAGAEGGSAKCMRVPR